MFLLISDRLGSHKTKMPASNFRTNQFFCIEFPCFDVVKVDIDFESFRTFFLGGRSCRGNEAMDGWQANEISIYEMEAESTLRAFTRRTMMFCCAVPFACCSFSSNTL